MHLTMSCAPALAARRALSRSLSVPAALPRVRASAGAVRTYSSALDTVKEKISSEKVVVFSKSYCPCVPRTERVALSSDARALLSYCVSVKALMTNVSVKPTIIELDEVGAHCTGAAAHTHVDARCAPCNFVPWAQTRARQPAAPRCKVRCRS
jgi:hypothetical protein